MYLVGGRQSVIIPAVPPDEDLKGASRSPFVFSRKTNQKMAPIFSDSIINSPDTFSSRKELRACQEGQKGKSLLNIATLVYSRGSGNGD